MSNAYNYERPIGPPTGGHLIPVNKGWGWNWTGRQRWDGRVRTYYTRTSYGNKQELKDAMEHLHPGVEFLDGGPADREPKIVMPLPPETFQRGILEQVKRELHGDARTRSPMRTIQRVRLLRPVYRSNA